MSKQAHDEVKDAARQAAAKAINGRLTDIGQFGQPGDAGVNSGLWGGQDHLGDFPFRFAQELQMALDFFQRIHITGVTHGLYLPDTGFHG